MVDVTSSLPSGETEQQGVGLPDAFARLWMPHRMAYIKGEGKRGCAFCDIREMEDEEGLVVARGEAVYAVLNLYPYNAGHLMVVPYRHVADYTDLSDAETRELAVHRVVDDGPSQGERRTRVQHRYEPGESPAPASPSTFTSMWFRGGAGTPTSCLSSDTPRCCRSC